jgi:hypothetical protein
MLFILTFSVLCVNIYTHFLGTLCQHLYSLSRYFVSTSLSPNPSPEVGGALIQKNCVYFISSVRLK